METTTTNLEMAPRTWVHSLVVYLSVLAPLGAFGAIAEDVYENEPFGFEEPVMWWIHARSAPVLDTLAGVLSWVGSRYGMAPTVALLALGLGAWRRRLGWFTAISLGGSTLLNVLTKLVFERPRPALWVPALPEPDTSFPSGHSMFAVSMAATLAVVAWPTRLRYPVLACGVLYALLMMLSRVYIGVHYPTDVMGGACFSLAWVAGLTRVVGPWWDRPRGTPM